MKMYQVLFGLVLVGVAAATDCGTLNINGTGPFAPPTTDPGPNKTCTWILMTNDSQITLDFSSLVVTAGQDFVTFYAAHNEKNILIQNFTDHKGAVTVVSPMPNMVVTLTRGPQTTMTASFSGTYNTKACAVAVNGSTKGSINSPVYPVGSGKIKCTYTVSLPSTEDKAVLAFTKFNLPNGAVDITFGSGSTVSFNGSNLPDDSFGDAGTTAINLILSLENTTALQDFSAIFFTANPGCSGKYNATDKFAFPTSGLPVTCYAQISAKKDEYVYVSVSSSDGSSVDFLDGSNIMAPVIGTASQEESAWFVSSGVAMTIRASLEPTSTARTTEFTVASSKTDRLYTVQDVPVTVPLTGAAAVSKSVHVQFSTVTNKRLTIAFNKTMKLTTGAVIIQDGSGFNFDFKQGSAFFPVTVTTNRLLLVIKNFDGNQSISATVSQTDKDDCNRIISDGTGSVIWDPRSLPTSKLCTLIMTPVITGAGEDSDLIVDFGTMVMCNDSTIDVYQGLENGAKLATFTGSYVTGPQIVFPQNAAARFVWTQKENCTQLLAGPALTASFRTQPHATTCSKFLAISSLMTPNFPNRYPLNAQCSRPIKPQNDTTLYLQLMTVDLSPAHPLTVSQTVGNKTTKLVSISGTSLPGDVFLDNKGLKIDFSAVPMVNGSLMMPGQGLNSSVKILSCGGELKNKTGSVNNPTAGNSSIECIWVITLPAKGPGKSVNIVSANLTVTNYTKDKPSGHLELRDGNSARDEGITLDFSKPTQTILSRVNSLWLRYTVLKPTTAKPLNFSLTYVTYKCSSLCTNGLCMHPGWKCNGHNDCGDGSDEFHCNGTGPTPAPHTSKTGVGAYWIPLCLIFGCLLGAVLVCVVPKLYRRVKTNNYRNL